MKMNKKITASILAMTMGAGLVGSISGTVAWYQYSTRAQLGMLGASIGLDRNLEAAVTAVSVDAAPSANSDMWKSELVTQDILNVYGETSVSLNPVTTSAAYDKNGSFDAITFKGNPIQYKTNPSQWAACGAKDVVEFKVWIRSTTRDGSTAQISNPTYVAKQLGLYDATIRNVTSGKEDISSAVRVQITAGTNYAVMAKDSAATDLYGPLDLDNVPGNDKPMHYSEVDTAGEDLVYGLENQQGKTYNLSNETRGEATSVLCDDPIAQTGENAGKLVIKGGLNLGATTNSEAASFKVKIWLEGWAKLGTTPSAMWATKDYVGSKFFVGLTVASGDARE